MAGSRSTPSLQGSAANVSNLQGWTNPTGAIKVWRNYSGMAAGEGSSNIELDRSGKGNRAEQVVTTQAGRTYTLSFMESPRPGVVAKSNSFEIYWNNTLLGTVARSGQNVSQPQWRTVTFPGDRNRHRSDLVPRVRQRQQGSADRRRAPDRQLITLPDVMVVVVGRHLVGGGCLRGGGCRRVGAG